MEVVGMRQKDRVLKAIIAYIEEHHYPPSTRDLCDLTGYKSTSSINRYVQEPIEEGKLETDNEYSPRALRVPGYKFVRCD